MKCDDDTFVRVDAVIKEANKIPDGGSLYVGNINYYHKPLRSGKWAVTYEVWLQTMLPKNCNVVVTGVNDIWVFGICAF